MLADRNISALAFDEGGRLWVGYFDRGLDILDPGVSRATHIENDHIFCVNRIVHDREQGVSAVATANGLVLFDATGRERQVLGRAQGLLADHVTDVLLRPGGMAVGTPAGVTLIDASGTRSLYAFQGLVNNHVNALTGSGKRLLVGTLGGLSVVDGESVRSSYTTANSGLRHNWITAIAPVGDDWFVGTYGAGILRFDTSGRWQPFTDATTPFVVNPGAMLATQAYVYAGTLGQGLLVYDRTSGRWNRLQAGLPSANVTALAARNGTIYVGTDDGLVRFPERSLPF
jgi:ligand-binding sensor domain-containing protein